LTPASPPRLIYRVLWRAAPRRGVGSTSPIHPIHEFGLLHRTPAGHNGSRDRHVEEIDCQRIVHDASRAQWSRDPAIRAEPRDDLIPATAQTLKRNGDPDTDWKPLLHPDGGCPKNGKSSPIRPTFGAAIRCGLDLGDTKWKQ
jgi:hypothetical protein